MTHHASRTLLPLAAACLCAASLLFGRTAAPQETEFTVHPVAGPISYVEGAGGNIGVMELDLGLFVVDSQLARAREGVLEAVESVGQGGVRYLLNTHWHGDHVGNNGALAGDAPILAHSNVRRRLVGDGSLEGRQAQATPAGDLPVMTYEDGLTLHLGGQTVDVRHVGSAHTDGDSVVFFREANVAHLGDVFFNGIFPFIDLESGGSVRGLIAAVATCLEELDAETRIIPGHGPLATRADFEAYQAMLLDCVSKVEAALAEGKDAAAMHAVDLLANYADWSWGFVTQERFLETLARDLAR